MKTLIAASIFLAILASSCSESSESVSLPSPTFPIVSTDTMDVPVEHIYVGEILGQTDIPVRARVSGFLEKIYFQEGSTIEKSAPLYLIDPQPFEEKVAKAQSNVNQAQTLYINAKNDFDRIEPLAKINAVSQSDLDAASANMKAAKSSLAAARAEYNIANIELGYTRVMAPVSGLVGKSMAVEGEFVGQFPNAVILTTISDIDSVLVEFYLSESEYLTLSRAYGSRDTSMARQKRKPLYLELADGSRFAHAGYATFINREVDPKTGTILIQAIFPNPDLLLRPGQFARVLVNINTIENAIVVPQRCIAETQGRFRVNVVNDSNIVEYRYIETGPKYGDYWVVTEGLELGEKIMLEGIQRVRKGQKIDSELTTFQSKRL